MKKSISGFTIVELLVVIVVIAILASITIVTFSGIQDRAKTSAAQTAASNAIKKIEIYLADDGRYPSHGSTIARDADPTAPYKLDGVTWGTPSATAEPSELAFYRCFLMVGIGTPGIRVDYYDYRDKTIKSFSTGTISGDNIECSLQNEPT